MRIGIDLGGTKIEGILLGDDGRERARDRVATPQESYPLVLDAVADVVARLDSTVAAGTPADRRPATVGIGTPGFLTPHNGLLINSNLQILNGHAIDRDLSARIGRSVRVANDAQCFVLSEVSDGAAMRHAGETFVAPDVVFGITLGTGVGGGVVIGTEVWGGTNGSAGQWSHITLPFLRPDDGPGGGCRCGNPGCIESFLSGHGLAWIHERQTGEELSPAEIGARSLAGDPRVAATFDYYEDLLARALAAVINLLDPRVIVVGGGISNNPRLFENVPPLWDRYTVAKDLSTRLVRAHHGDASGVRGAAWLWAAT